MERSPKPSSSVSYTILKGLALYAACHTAVYTNVTNVPLNVTFYPASLNPAKRYAIFDQVDKYIYEHPGVLSTVLGELKRVVTQNPAWLLQVTALLLAVRFIIAMPFASSLLGVVPKLDSRSIMSPRMDFLTQSSILLYLWSMSAGWPMMIWLGAKLAVTTISILRLPIHKIGKAPSKIQGSPILAEWLEHGIAVISIALASLNFVRETESSWFGVAMGTVVAYLYASQMATVIVFVLSQSPESLSKMTIEGLLKNILDAALDNCMAWIFITPLLYRVATFRHEIGALALVGAWLVAKRKTSNAAPTLSACSVAEEKEQWQVDAEAMS